MKSYKKFESERESLMFVKRLCQFTEKKAKEEFKVFTYRIRSKITWQNYDCYVTVYYASGRERKRETEGERTARYPVNTID